ncbi:uncharacterized protein LOC119689330 [Teleopsis dalmanni]|uniref:uncharacterized protein LOC119689330 n=1 Tax=Teleopsis dalmanni TaxID=139649 RepID=UPI0018CD9C6C|nr:uncharacterized protein LOC119689330 [Teleopsis dalmanni]
MINRTPDYIISGCGYPHWKNERNNLENIKFSLPEKAIKNMKTDKLLPLRETLTEYYFRLQRLPIHKNLNYFEKPTQQKQKKENINKSLKQSITFSKNRYCENKLQKHTEKKLYPTKTEKEQNGF